MKIFNQKLIDKLFEIGIMVKMLFGFFELLAGVLFSFSKEIINDNFIINMAQQEIAQDISDKDIIADFLVKTANSVYQDSAVFAIAYLLFHGAVNIFLAVSLANEKAKTYPAIIGFLLIFISYQTYKYFHSFSPSLLFLTGFDIIFVWIIWLEYKKRLKK